MNEEKRRLSGTEQMPENFKTIPFKNIQRQIKKGGWHVE
jgi:hypothetical protein